MSMPAVFFTASDDDAANVEFDHNLPAGDYVEVGGIGILELSLLWAVVESKGWDVVLMDAFQELKSTSSDWTYRLPDGLTHQIERLREPELERVAREWTAAEGMDCRPEEAKRLLVAIAPVARRANRTGRGLFILNTCL